MAHIGQHAVRLAVQKADHLIDDLRSRDRVSGNVTRDGALGQLLIDEYVNFPISTASSVSSTG